MPDRTYRANRRQIRADLSNANRIVGPRKSFVNRILDCLSAHSLISCALAGIVPLVARALLLKKIPVPEPWNHDEFSYLLGADTFRSGRLANPSHPLWRHFETFHVNQRPTYVSKYPPCQALVLACGQSVLGQPWFGVWLSVGLMCSSICWMLQGWMPAKWALLGSGLAAARLGIVGYWMNSLYGGAVAATGGSLVLGALPRLIRKPHGKHTLVGTLGLIILASSRPYEGLWLAISTAFALLYSNHWRPPAIGSLPGLLPSTLLLGASAVAMAYYNFRTSGSFVRTPYRLNQEQYSVVPILLWQSLSPVPFYRHAELRRYWLQWDVQESYHKRKRNPLLVLGSLMYISWSFFFYGCAVLVLPVLVGASLFSLARVRIALLISAIFALGPLQVRSWTQAHYLAPVAPLFYLFAAYGLRYLHLVHCRQRTRGPSICTQVVTLCLTTLMTKILANIRQPSLVRADERSLPGVSYFLQTRTRILKCLARDAARHVVIVRYSPEHNIHFEWVYNLADIDGAPVVWARDCGVQDNQALLDYYSDRKIWLLQPDRSPLELVPYGAAVEDSPPEHKDRTYRDVNLSKNREPDIAR